MPAAAQVADTTRADSAVSLAPLVVTAAKVPVRLDRVGISVSVLSSADLKSRHPSNAADALRNLDGAFIDEANGPGGPTIVRLASPVVIGPAPAPGPPRLRTARRPGSG